MAIAVDNLADAESLTAIEKEEADAAEAEAEADLDKSNASETVTKDGDDPSQDEMDEEDENGGQDGKDGDQDNAQVNQDEENGDSRQRSTKKQVNFSSLIWLFKDRTIEMTTLAWVVNISW